VTTRVRCDKQIQAAHNRDGDVSPVPAAFNSRNLPSICTAGFRSPRSPDHRIPWLPPRLRDSVSPWQVFWLPITAIPATRRPAIRRLPLGKPLEPPTPYPVIPKCKGVREFNPGVPTKPGVGFAGWKPGVDFVLFPPAPTLEQRNLYYLVNRWLSD